MADLTQYVDPQLVIDELPTNYSTSDLPPEAVVQFVIEESRDIDLRLGSTYCTFNAFDHATFPTPTTIQEIVRDGSTAKCLMRIGMGDRTSIFGTMAKERADNALRMKQAIAGHDQVMGGSGAGPVVESDLAFMVERVDSETITFGTGASQFVLNTNEAYVPVEAYLDSDDIPTIIPDSIRVTTGNYMGYRFADRPGYGINAICYFDGTRQRWVLRDLSGYISGSGATAHISYRWEYRRATWRPIPYEEDDEIYFGGAV